MSHRLVALGLVALLCTTCTSAASVSDGGTETSPTGAPTATTAADTPDGPSTVVMWASGGLPPDVAGRASRLPAVEAAVHVSSDTLGLVEATDGDGAVVESLDDAWRIPVDVTAVAPGRARAVLPAGPTRDAVGALRPGQAVLTRTAAELRGIGVGGTVVLLGGHRLDVVGVVPDETLGRDEVIVHARDRGKLGIEATGSVLVRLDQAVDDQMRTRLGALGPDDTPVRVDVAAGPDTARGAPLVLGLPEVKARFGEFAFRDDSPDREIHPDPAWVDEHIVVQEVPILGNIRCHRAIFDDLRRALQAVVDAGLASEIHPEQYGGCYYPRRIGASTEALSRHSWGIAVDINVDFSVPGMGPPPDQRVIEAFAAAGFRWGGLFLTPDNHHFEWVGDAAGVTPPAPRMGQTPQAGDG